MNEAKKDMRELSQEVKKLKHAHGDMQGAIIGVLVMNSGQFTGTFFPKKNEE